MARAGPGFRDPRQTIAANPDRATWPSWVQKATNDVAAEIEAAETAYASTMFKSIVEGLNPGATSWAEVRSNRAVVDALAAGIASNQGLDLCARMFAEELADLVGIVATDEQLQRAADTLKATFQLPLRLHNALMYRIVKDGADVSRPELANTVWDVQLALTIPLAASRTPVWLITNERLILTAARDAGAEHVVHSLGSYLDLTRDGDALRSVINRFTPT